MRRRDNTGQRRLPRARQYTILVYCGAVRTEPDYLEGLRAATRSAGVTVKILRDGIAPEALVRAAAAYRDRKPGVYDHAECRAYCNGYADVVARLRKYVPAYDKRRLGFAHYAVGVDDAVKRAKDLEPTGTDHKRNPSPAYGSWLK